nr:hypothetical protein [uncultured Carboxylicivirga sp.]
MNLKYLSIKTISQDFLSGNIDNIAQELLSTLKSNSIDKRQIVKIDLVYSSSDQKHYPIIENNFEETLTRLYKKHKPSHEILINESTDLDGSIFQLTVCMDENCKIEHKEFQKFTYTLVSDNQQKLLFASSIRFNQDNDLIRNTQLVFDFAEQLLDHEEMHFGHVINFKIRLNKSDNLDRRAEFNTINQIKDLYLNPELFNQSQSPFLMTTGYKTEGIELSFKAAQKDNFPIHQTKHTSVKGYTTSVSKQNELNQQYFSISSESSSIDNIITQTNECCKRINTLKKDSAANHITLDHIYVYYANNDDLNDIKTIITQELKTTNLYFIKSQLKDPQALIAIEGVFTYGVLS